MLKASGFALFALLGLPSLGWTHCGDRPGDATSTADARAAVDATCSCSGLPTHNAYLVCARAVIAQRIAAGSLSEACAAQIKQCVSRSTCGSPGAAACCTTTRDGSSPPATRSTSALASIPALHAGR